MAAYYNEHDPFAAAWLRELIKAGHIADGVVDERSIEDVFPSDLSEFTQCHFFAGIGVWSYALRRAGWSDDRPVWTGSCPCQPFSSAGKAAGFADERHLWPSFYHLIEHCRPAVVFGEQVASKAVDDWIDLVHADLEAVGYAFGSVPFPSAGVGAPHIRDRNYWMADSMRSGQPGQGVVGRPGDTTPQADREVDRTVDVGRGCGMGDNNNPRLEGLGSGHQAESRRLGAVGSAPKAGESGGVADASRAQEHEEQQRPAGDEGGRCANESRGRGLADASLATGPTNGHWRDADWLFCRDGKWRPVEPGTFPLAHGAPARVGRLRGYGNAINAEAAIAFIEAYLNK